MSNWAHEPVVCFSRTIFDFTQFPLLFFCCFNSNVGLFEFELVQSDWWAICINFCNFVKKCSQIKRQAAKVSWPPEGVAGVDYPTYNEVPSNLAFDCKDKLAGYYADPEAQCQVTLWFIRTARTARTALGWPEKIINGKIFRLFSICRCGTGVCLAANATASCAPTKPCSTKIIASATGGTTSSAASRPASTPSTRICTRTPVAIPFKRHATKLCTL